MESGQTEDTIGDLGSLLLKLEIGRGEVNYRIRYRVVEYVTQ